LLHCGSYILQVYACLIENTHTAGLEKESCSFGGCQMYSGCKSW